MDPVLQQNLQGRGRSEDSCGQFYGEAAFSLQPIRDSRGCTVTFPRSHLSKSSPYPATRKYKDEALSSNVRQRWWAFLARGPEGLAPLPSGLCHSSLPSAQSCVLPPTGMDAGPSLINNVHTRLHLRVHIPPVRGLSGQPAPLTLASRGTHCDPPSAD